LRGKYFYPYFPENKVSGKAKMPKDMKIGSDEVEIEPGALCPLKPVSRCHSSQEPKTSQQRSS
jgi:hypothetical protein